MIGGWKYDGRTRPAFAESPSQGQESVWDYPRPPAISRDRRVVTVSLEGMPVAETSHALRVMETASPPTFYLPPEDVRSELLQETAGSSFCEWKGHAHYFSLVTAAVELKQVGWSYAYPKPGFEQLADYIAFYPAKLECFVDGERVRPQPGGFYGRWLTADIAGPVKGTPGTQGW